MNEFSHSRANVSSGDAARVVVVLSAGGLRGAAHVGVLRQLVRLGLPIDAIVGVSAGAVVAAYYAAVGLGFDELIHDAEIFRGRHLLAYSAAVRFSSLEPSLATRCGVIPERLRQLEAARFDRLHHGVQRLAIVCHDLATGAPSYFATGSDRGVPVAAAVRASASIPVLFPAVSVACDNGEAMRLTDGGLSDDVPLAFARGPLAATHVVVSDCRWIGRERPTDPSTVWIRPRMRSTGTLWSPARGLMLAVRDGEEAVSRDVCTRIAAWSIPRSRHTEFL